MVEEKEEELSQENDINLRFIEADLTQMSSIIAWEVIANIFDLIYNLYS